MTGRILRQGRKFRQAVERDVELARRTAHLEMLDAVDEGFWQGVLVDELQEGALDVGIRDHEVAAHFLAVGKHDAGRRGRCGS